MCFLRWASILCQQDWCLSETRNPGFERLQVNIERYSTFSQIVKTTRSTGSSASPLISRSATFQLFLWQNFMPFFPKEVTIHDSVWTKICWNEIPSYFRNKNSITFGIAIVGQSGSLLEICKQYFSMGIWFNCVFLVLTYVNETRWKNIRCASR